MALSDDPGREQILTRIRAAIGSAAPVPPIDSQGELFPLVKDPLARFQVECGANNTECIVLPDRTACGEALSGLLASLPAGEIFVQDTPVLHRGVAAAPQERDIRWSSQGPPSETSVATVTLAEALIAETGSVLVSAACGGRGASLVAPVHIVLAHAGQLVASLAAGLESIRANRVLFSSSSVCLITGSSRTADIEKVLVLGAHGPRRLVVLLSQRAE